MKYKLPNKIIYQDEKIVKFLIESPKYGNIEVLIDVEDYNKIKNYRWYAHLDKRTNSFYVRTHIERIILLSLHRVILNLTNPKIKGDHKDHNTLDNRKQNLRVCTQSENLRNQKLHKNNKSGYKGIRWRNKNKKWEAYIGLNHKYTHLGSYKNKLDAVLAYNQAAIKYYGEFARLNNV